MEEVCRHRRLGVGLIRVGGGFPRPSFNESDIMVGVPRRRDINQARGRRYVRHEHNGPI